MDKKIISFEEFSNKPIEQVDENSENPHHQESSGDDHKNYMFFQNLSTIKHYVEEILSYSPEDIDNLINNGHDWASDHIETSKDDIQEVCDWIRNEITDLPKDSFMEDEPEIEVNVEGNDDKVEVEDEKKEEGEDDEDDEDDE